MNLVLVALFDNDKVLQEGFASSLYYGYDRGCHTDSGISSEITGLF